MWLLKFPFVSRATSPFEELCELQTSWHIIWPSLCNLLSHMIHITLSTTREKNKSNPFPVDSRVIGDEKDDSKFCEQCGVEFVDSRIQRYQMGYIKLLCPVTHVWYLKRLPSYIANILDKPLKELEGLVYCDV